MAEKDDALLRLQQENVELREQLCRQAVISEKKTEENQALRAENQALRAENQELKEALRKVTVSDKLSKDEEEEPPKGDRLPEVIAESETDEYGYTALHLAAGDGDAERVRVLLERGLDTRAKNRWGMTPLFTALWCGEEAAADVLALADSQSDIQGEGGWTPLHIAALKGYVGVINKLLAVGADTRAQDNYLYTPLHIAIQVGKVVAAELLASVDGQNDIPDKDGCTPLHHAAREGYLQVSKMLLSGGVHPHAKDNAGNYPLSEALSGDHDVHHSIARLILASCALRDIAIDWKAIELPTNQMERGIRMLSEYEDEIGRMKETRIPESRLTFYAAARRHPCRVAPYLLVESIGHVLEGGRLVAEFPNYGELIASKLSQVRERRVLSDRCVECFSRMLPRLPLPCIEVVLLCLSEDDLRNFLLALEPQTRS